MKYEVISLEAFSDLHEQSLNIYPPNPIENSMATVLQLSTQQGDLIAVTLGDKAVIIRS